MWETVLGVLSSGGIGGILGLFGSLGNTWLKYKADKDERAFKIQENKDKRAHSILMLKAETDASIKEIEANLERDKIIMEGKADIEETSGRNEAIVKLSENYVKQSFTEKMMFNTNLWTAWLTVPVAIIVTFVHSVVDVLRTLVRVIITYGSVAFSCYVTWLCFEMMQKLNIALSSKELLDIVMIMLKLLTFTTSTVISFWFMDKSMSRKFQNN